MQTYDQPTNSPTNKVTAGAVGGALAVILAWVLEMQGIVVPPAVAAAFALILGTVAAYFTRERVQPAVTVEVKKGSK